MSMEILLFSLIVLFFLSLSSLFLSDSPFYYACILIFLSLLATLSLATFMFLSSIYPILFLLIYVGAMMVMIGYVCALSPSSPSNSFLFNPGLFFPSILALSSLAFWLSWPSSLLTYLPVSSKATNFYYSSLGSEVFFFLALILLLILLISSSLLKVKSTLRSL